MNDTRLIQMRGLAQDIQEISAELLSEPIKDPHDVVNIARAGKFAAAIMQAANASYTAPVCKSHNTVGSVCAEPDGHPGEHRSEYGATWTDKSTALAAEWMSRNV